ncbi:substrate-binding domain-containing protein [Curtobacterium flaccumfaciens]|nr:substrate-binding domain-containing protein [Curtobacterium flaccumfaciens]
MRRSATPGSPSTRRSRGLVPAERSPRHARAARPPRRDGGLRRQRPDGDRRDVRHPAGGPVRPGDISIVGFDDMPIAAYLPTPLTTIRQDFEEATRLAMHRLFRTLDGHPPAERHRMLPGQLITRATSAPPSAERRRLRPAD